MDFGRLSSVDHIDFTLPKDDVSNASLFKRIKKETAEKFELFVGCPVWADKTYVGSLYPPKTKPKDFLHFYSRQFNCIELNATHYKLPSESQVLKWKLDVPDDFHFCPKFPQIISHRKNIGEQRGIVDEFLTSIYFFEQNLGTSFLQLPPYFGPRDRDYLYRFIDYMPSDFDLSVELRNEQWFLNEEIKKELFDFFEEKGITTVITDVAGRRDVLHQRITTDTAFIRFTGNNLHQTDYSRLNEWISRLLTWKKEGLRKLYFFLHEPTKSDAAKIAGYFIEKMTQADSTISIKAPRFINENYQQSLF